MCLSLSLWRTALPGVGSKYGAATAQLQAESAGGKEAKPGGQGEQDSARLTLTHMDR